MQVTLNHGDHGTHRATLEAISNFRTRTERQIVGEPGTFAYDVAEKESQALQYLHDATPADMQIELGGR